MSAAGAPLRLRAEDAEGLGVLSAVLQDAILRLGDLAYDPRARTLTLTAARMRREARRPERVKSALQLGGVLALRTRRLRRDAPDAVVSLLALEWRPAEPPGGVLRLLFAGGADLEAEVEALDLLLLDVSDPWATRRTPVHD